MIMAETSTRTDEGFTAADLADCAEREVRQRQRFYPRLIASGRMAQAKAERQTVLMQAIARKLRAEADLEAESEDLFGGVSEAPHG
ncbi:hypothetical protein SB2_02870 [Methylobacterium radiotolerans]|nr:hypothetical protein SB3_16475 [Methylobacterium radiotolerans]KTS50477.1 hypothetical protein SB2_02870 [Methylobacterium radiotolerans]